MLSVEIDEENAVVVLEPDGPLSKDDFAAAAQKIDPLIKKTGRLNGIIIHTESFPGWDSFAALLAHLKFVKGHHEKISRVALATDSSVKHVAETIARHFVSAEIKVFSFQELGQARQWVVGGEVSDDE